MPLAQQNQILDVIRAAFASGFDVMNLEQSTMRTPVPILIDMPALSLISQIHLMLYGCRDWQDCARGA